MQPVLELCFPASIVLFPLTAARTAGRRALRVELPAVVTNSSPVGRLPGTTNLDMAIGLPLRNQEALTNLLWGICAPASANFRHIIKQKP